MRDRRKGGFLLAAGVIFVAVSVFVKDSYYANILRSWGIAWGVIGFLRLREYFYYIIFIAFSCYFRYLLSYQLNNTKEKRVLEKRGVLMDLTILVVGLILGVGIPLRNKAIKKRRENMKEKGNEEK